MPPTQIAAPTWWATVAAISRPASVSRLVPWVTQAPAMTRAAAAAKAGDAFGQRMWAHCLLTGLGTTKNPPGINLGRHYLSFNGTTPFFHAARNGDGALMKLLLQYGADAKIPSALNVTPLMVAAGLAALALAWLTRRRAVAG